MNKSESVSNILDSIEGWRSCVEVSDQDRVSLERMDVRFSQLDRIDVSSSSYGSSRSSLILGFLLLSGVGGTLMPKKPLLCKTSEKPLVFQILQKAECPDFALQDSRYARNMAVEVYKPNIVQYRTEAWVEWLRKKRKYTRIS
ncbi:hypothetical protein L596_011139 [Steinernema carpocapsae]|uniref:Uncharacterized protein n=1 Tax=Steinernema carpocapsae TaxID=34508 RepID=A0A4U5NTR3_STECR|nr:hypothetical protein L596_011139 [Steinernema carpocapsae]